MKKIPTIFVRDHDGTIGPPGRFLLNEPHPDCGWVFAGEGVATRKLDGTCCLVRDGVLYKRHEVRIGKTVPDGFEPVDSDEQTQKLVGWVPVGDGPEDKRHREAFARELDERGTVADGTYELIGPKVNGNPERAAVHLIIPHADTERLQGVPTGFDDLRAWLRDVDVEGVVWHHPDGRMAKIKGKDFGITRGG